MTEACRPPSCPEESPSGERPCEDPALVGLLPSAMVVTIRGERAADEIEAGEIVVVLASAGYAPVQRVTESMVDLARRPEAAPVLVMKGAFDGFSPLRTTVLGPQCLIGLEDWLVPAATLVNGRSIRRLPGQGLVRYVQIEMGRHDMVVADGVRVGSLCRGTAPCRPLLREGLALEVLRGRLRARIPLLEASGLLPPDAQG